MDGIIVSVLILKTLIHYEPASTVGWYHEKAIKRPLHLLRISTGNTFIFAYIGQSSSTPDTFFQAGDSPSMAASVDIIVALLTHTHI